MREMYISFTYYTLMYFIYQITKTCGITRILSAIWALFVLFQPIFYDALHRPSDQTCNDIDNNSLREKG